MSTTLYMRLGNIAACDNWGPPDAPWNPNTAFYSTGVNGMAMRSLRLDRGNGLQSGASAAVSSSTARHRFNSTSFMFVSPPVDRAVTIASTVTFNFWGLESAMTSNCQMGGYVAKISPDGTVSSVIADATKGAELGTSSAVQNFTATPTSTALAKGDRILIVPYFTNIGTMGTGSIQFDYNGTVAGVTGDSYVTFTEDFGFMQDLNPTSPAGGSNYTWGTTSVFSAAFPFRLPKAATLTSVTAALGASGSPADNVTCSIRTSSGGSPSGTTLASASIAVTGASADRVFDIADTALSADTVYWVVFSRTGSLDDANFYTLQVTGAATQTPWNAGGLQFDNGLWGPAGNQVGHAVLSLLDGSTLYPTDTAGQVDPNGASYDSYEAWTSRGGGAATSVTTSTAAPASPLLATATQGGNFIEWFTKQLQAVTLAGPVLVNGSVKEGNTLANATVGLELAVCAADGTSPTVWAYTLLGSELSTTQDPWQWFIAGDDLAITAGQRIRLRFYWDDASNASMAATYGLTVGYAGVTPGGLGDTYLTFGQTLAEFVSTGIAELIAADIFSAGE